MNKTILIVEDEFIVADDLQLTLQQAGYKVCGITDNVPAAREIIQQEKPSLVLLDIYLKGGLNGIVLAQELKEQNMAFIYLSANSNQKILEAAKATEPYGFLVKPFREKDLLVMLDIAFYRHENSLEARWRREIQLQKELYTILQSDNDWQKKILQTTKALQQYIPFDCLTVQFKAVDSDQYSMLALLRIGFDEYQTIGTGELCTISGLSHAAVLSLLSEAPAGYAMALHNGGEFRKMLQQNPLKALLARVFQFSSSLGFPSATGAGYTFSMCFFSRNAKGFTLDQHSWLPRLQMAVMAIMDSIFPLEKYAPAGYAATAKKGKPAEISRNASFEGIIGNSASLLTTLDLAAQVAPLNTSVLLLGESGTGKEKIASCIHELSPRKNKPFIKINCSALPPTLIESELFGHEKGSFTNALERRIGRFELADTGTLFLDEIGDMPAELQVKLLRVLQEKEIERIGGKQPIKVDVRIIAATNRNLQTEMAEGKFRLDLYYRLNVFPIHLPALRERREDIRQLAEFFARRFSTTCNRSYMGISSQMMAELESYHFPGNIRELENIMEQSVILNDGRSELVLRQSLLPYGTKKDRVEEKLPAYQAVKTIEDVKRLQRQTEIDYLSSVLSRTHGRIRGKEGAAELLNQKPTTLESRMAKLGIRKEDFL